ncbi:MMPL family transporter [Couchioplanes azureus]|uniref:MMPL family transporter n=1 Tax=Couchioplanes caeruleus TaxID=56438 RepID=UPI0016714219|nr:MMPL family transporter [Couchioplanes caeruleus]GGQ62923.1 membrane protein [Couchioplanes caeruleus subsp. azureus]
MATYLYRLGRFAFRRRALVLTMWLALLAVLGVGAATLSGPTAESFSIPGTEAQQAQDLLAERFPQAGAGGAEARVVFAAPAGEKLTDPENRAAIEATVARLRTGARVGAVTDPLPTGINPAGTVAYAQVTYKVRADALTGQDREVLSGAAAAGRAAGLTVETGGDALREPAGQGVGEVVGFLVAAVVLLVTFGSLVAAGLPLVTAVIGVGAAMAGIQIVSGFVDLSSNTPTLALMLGTAVAIDYALFIVSRYRHEVAAGRAGIEAAGRAVGTAGSAVTFAGLTVIIALAALAVVNVPVLTQMGLAAAAAVAVAVLIALTLLPALLGFAGGRVTGRHGRARDPEGDDARPTAGRRWARLVTRRPVPALLGATLALLVVAIPALDLRLGLPGDNMSGPQTTQRRAYDMLTAGFGPGFNGPLLVVVDAGPGADAKAVATEVGTAVSGLPDVAKVGPAAVNPAGDTAILQVVPRSAPDSRETTDLVHAIRDTDEALPGEILVTGTTALNIDMSAKLGAALGPYLAVIVILAFLLLTVLFRALLVPLKAIAGFLLSVAATFGAVVAVFQWGWLAGPLGVEQTGPVVSLMPVVLIGIVFGLAMDYEVFLVSRMREEHVHGAAPGRAVVNGFGHGARVVTAAAVIMISVFAGFVLSDDSMIKSIGFALAAAILLDAFVVRMTIVPAAMALLGRRAWALPRWLDRILPDVDVEGDRLRAGPHAPRPEPELVAADR